MNFTKKEMMDAFLLFLDDVIHTFDCKQVKEKGNKYCKSRCDLCIVEQYLSLAKKGKLPKIALQCEGIDYPVVR